jgi:hypothetical protein
MAYKFPAWDTKEDKDAALQVVLDSLLESLKPLRDFKNGTIALKSGDALQLLAACRFLIGFAKALEYAKPEEINRAIFDKIARLANAMDSIGIEKVLHDKISAKIK